MKGKGFLYLPGVQSFHNSIQLQKDFLLLVSIFLILDVGLLAACSPCSGFFFSILSAPNSLVRGLSPDSLSADSEDSTNSGGRSEISP